MPPKPPLSTRLVKRHSALVRICHWVNAVAFILLLDERHVQIFNATPAFSILAKWTDL